jgi:hypothetical protein
VRQRTVSVGSAHMITNDHQGLSRSEVGRPASGASDIFTSTERREFQSLYSPPVRSGGCVQTKSAHTSRRSFESSYGIAERIPAHGEVRPCMDSRARARREHPLSGRELGAPSPAARRNARPRSRLRQGHKLNLVRARIRDRGLLRDGRALPGLPSARRGCPARCRAASPIASMR